jgi:hypothetical protein
MAAQPGRYLEGRLYMAWAALALLLASWAGVAVHDQLERQRDDAQSAVIDADATGRSQAQTRTRGS